MALQSLEMPCSLGPHSLCFCASFIWNALPAISQPLARSSSSTTSCGKASPSPLGSLRHSCLNSTCRSTFDSGYVTVPLEKAKQIGTDAWKIDLCLAVSPALSCVPHPLLVSLRALSQEVISNRIPISASVSWKPDLTQWVEFTVPPFSDLCISWFRTWTRVFTKPDYSDHPGNLWLLPTEARGRGGGTSSFLCLNMRHLLWTGIPWAEMTKGWAVLPCSGIDPTASLLFCNHKIFAVFRRTISLNNIK